MNFNIDISFKLLIVMHLLDVGTRDTEPSIPLPGDPIQALSVAASRFRDEMMRQMADVMKQNMADFVQSISDQHANIKRQLEEKV